MQTITPTRTRSNLERFFMVLQVVVLTLVPLIPIAALITGRVPLTSMSAMWALCIVGICALGIELVVWMWRRES